jgi:DNA polymerase-3 subunit alpha
VGASAVEGIIAAREEGGPYRDIEDFCKRAGLAAVNSRALENLARAGALDGLYPDRGTLVMNVERMLNLARRERELRESGQSTMFDLFGSQVDTPLPALELEAGPGTRREDMLAWERELLGVYMSEHPFRAAAQALGAYTTHSLSDVTMELAGQTVAVAGMVNRVQARATRDGRKFYVVDVEDLSGSAELTVWNDTIEATGEGLWAEGQVLLLSVECRERGDRLGLSVRRAAPFNSVDGSVVGFSPEQWQAPPPRRAGPRNGEAPKRPNGERAPQQANGNGNGRSPRAPAPGAVAGPAAEASRPGVQPPVSGDTARLVVTIYETEDRTADEALLRAVAGMLKDSPGKDEVRLVIHDVAGQETEFDLPRAGVNDALARSIRSVLRSSGMVSLTSARVAGAA